MPDSSTTGSPPRTLLGRVRTAVRARHYSPRTEASYVGWVKRFVVFHGRRHPDELGEADVRAFLDHLAEHDGVSASTQNQAVAALLFLYEAVLGRRLALSPQGIVHAKELHRLPVVLSREEVRAVLAQLKAVSGLVGLLLYGSGLRLLECLSLRVKDVDFHRGEIRVRGGKGGVDRVVPLPLVVQGPLGDHLTRWRARHAREVQAGAGEWSYQAHLSGRSVGRRTIGLGSGYFRLRGPTAILFRVSSGGITCTSPRSSAPSGTQCKRPGSRSGPHVTHFDTRSPPIYSSRGPISGRCRSYWGIETFGRR